MLFRNLVYDNLVTHWTMELSRSTWLAFVNRPAPRFPRMRVATTLYNSQHFPLQPYMKIQGRYQEPHQGPDYYIICHKGRFLATI
jgi:hypothetical protein